MKFRWEKKYLYWGVTALLVVIGGLIAYYLMFHGGNFKDHLQTLLRICMPILDGFILAWLMCPLVNGIEHFALYPARDWLIQKYPSLQAKKKKLTNTCRGISIVLTLCFVLFLIYGFFRVVIPQIFASLKSIADQIQTLILHFPSYVNAAYEWTDKLFSNNPDLETAATDLINNYSKDLETFFNKTLIPQLNTQLNILLKTVSLSVLSFAKAIWNLVIGLIISIYLLASKERFVSQGKKLLYAFWDTRQANAIMEDVRLIDSTFGGFISGKILDSAIIGVICFVVLNIMHMPYPMLISVIIGVTNIIPFFGPFIGAVPSALIILMVNPIQCLYFIIFIWILQQFDGNFLGPKILGDSTGLSGFWIIFSITIFSGIMGVPGMILGVPIFAVIYALIKRRVNRNLQKKGMSDKTEEYQTLDYVDAQTGAFVSKPEDKPARHRKKQYSFRNFKEDLKTFIPHPAEHPAEPAETTVDANTTNAESSQNPEKDKPERNEK